jgi:hypothetical protein
MFASDKDPCKHRDKEIRAVIDDITLPASLAQFFRDKLLSELSKLHSAITSFSRSSFMKIWYKFIVFLGLTLTSSELAN